MKVAGSLCAAMAMVPALVFAASPWPAESNTAAYKLPGLDPYFVANMSGAYWNATTRTFWVCCNGPGTFWALVENGLGGWKIGTSGGNPARWEPGGDLEGICQPDDTLPIVFLMDENGYIRKYSVSVGGTVNQVQAWNISANAGAVSGSGPEAITFVPDSWLSREGFRDATGALRTSTQGMGGLMLVGHQTGGYVHVFDLKADGTFLYHGKILSSRSETADISFDRIAGKLYIWHNTGSNYLEVAELNSIPVGSERRFRTLIEYTGPRAGNLEGIATVSNPAGDDWIMLTDDDNNPVGEALTIYQHFVPNNDTDGDGLADDWELRYFGSATHTSGAPDPDGDSLTNREEYVFGLDPTKGTSANPVSDTSELTTLGRFKYTRCLKSPAAYTVWTSTDLKSWAPDPGATEVSVIANSNFETVTVHVTSTPVDGKLFVRVRAQ